MTRTYVLTLNEMPPSSNRPAAQRQAGYRLKKDWQGKFLVALMMERVERDMTHANAEITVRWKHRNRRDWHNYFGNLVKPLADALVSGRYLADDTGDHFNVTTPFRFEYPDQWPAGLHKVELIVVLECEYA